MQSSSSQCKMLPQPNIFPQVCSNLHVCMMVTKFHFSPVNMEKHFSPLQLVYLSLYRRSPTAFSLVHCRVWVLYFKTSKNDSTNHDTLLLKRISFKKDHLQGTHFFFLYVKMSPSTLMIPYHQFYKDKDKIQTKVKNLKWQ